MRSVVKNKHTPQIKWRFADLADADSALNTLVDANATVTNERTITKHVGVGRGGCRSGGVGSGPSTPGVQPPTPPIFFAHSPLPLFTLFFFRVHPPKILILPPAPRPSDPRPPAHFSPNEGPPTPLPYPQSLETPRHKWCSQI